MSWTSLVLTVFCVFFLLRDNDFDYMEFRLWIGLWSAFFCLVLVATDASFLVKYFTRFTEEGFSCLISFIFIYDAFKKMIKLAHHYPINSVYSTENITRYGCLCMGPTLLGEPCVSSTDFTSDEFHSQEINSLEGIKIQILGFFFFALKFLLKWQ